MALDYVADYITRARVLLQDTVEDYRYPTADLVEALNLAVMDARRLRPDLFLTDFSVLQEFAEADAEDDAEVEVSIDPMYRTAFVYYIVGHAQLRDEEDTQDARATVLLNKFNAILTSVA